ncbi:MAG: glycoside hydrolase family 3 N-terminal domain-containing protein [Gemmatimonadaceae bacterium]
MTSLRRTARRVAPPLIAAAVAACATPSATGTSTGTSAVQAPSSARVPYRNASLPIERRVDDLLSRMTLEEKVAQMLCLWQQKRLITDSAGRFDAARAPAWFRAGIGRIERPNDGHDARAEAEFTNAVQRWVRDSTRLGIPVLFNEEALHGLEAVGATSFPQAIALASSWNPELVERVFARTAEEARARGVHQVLAPVVDVAREPRWGRFEETYGEDPYLAARMGVAAVRGFQGTDTIVRAPKVLATLKHMTGHGQPESGTNVGPTSIGERTLRDVFLYPFEVAVKEGNAQSIMASYNEIDGIPSHANRWMLNDLLREEWGFKGTVVSDWFAINELVTRHSLAADSTEAARRALNATVDIELPDPAAYPTLVQQVRDGRVSQRQVDAAVRRLLRAKFQLGLFESPFVDADAADRVSGAAEARPLALEAARQSIILLKNDGGTLPLRADALQRVAVIGPHASEVLLGGYSGTPKYAVSILDGIRARLGSGATVEHAEGVRITEDSVFTKEAQPHAGGTRSHARWGADRVVPADSAGNARRIADAVALARRSQVAVVVVGDNEQTAREAYADNHLGDRTSLGLAGQQEQLVEAVLATGTPTVLVLMNGRPASIPRLAARVPAILEGWYLGQETGTAVAEVLFGDYNPGGKLPATVARDVGQLPMFYDRKPTARRGYVMDTTAPLWAFGYGLSYTSFAYGAPRVSPAQIPVTGRTTVSVDVTNTGSRAGDEVVQLYIRDRVSMATRPLQQLRGFRRVALRPGETRTVTFELGPEHLSYHGLEMKRVVEPGQFDVMVGGSSDRVQTVRLDVVGSAPAAASLAPRAR